jgi:hypothetical protein
MIGVDNGRLSTIIPRLLEKNYKWMNRVFLALSITVPTPTFTNPTMF